VTEHQIQCLDRYEMELRPGLPPIDRNIEIPHVLLARRVQEVRQMLPTAGWPAEKLYAQAICWLVTLGYPPGSEPTKSALFSSFCA
jgi:hypothetical protein